MHPIIEEDIQNIADEKLPWEKLINKKILITGANGFLASYIVYVLMLCNKIYNLNIIVYALCRNMDKALYRFSGYIHDKNFVILNQDVCDDISDKYQSDVIIHAASPANQYACHQHPYKVIEANILAYDKLLKKYNVWQASELILISSSAIYGQKTSVTGVNELYRDSINFTDYKNVYAISKQMCEMMTECIMKESNYNIKVVRPFVVYGPGDYYSNKKIMTGFLKNYLCDEDIILESNNDVIRSYIYIRDAVKGIFYVMLCGNNDAYNIASEANILNISELAEIFAGIDRKKRNIKCLEANNDLKKKSFVLIGRNDKLKELGWKEEINIEDGIIRMVEWARDSDFLRL